MACSDGQPSRPRAREEVSQISSEWPRTSIGQPGESPQVRGSARSSRADAAKICCGVENRLPKYVASSTGNSTSSPGPGCSDARGPRNEISTFSPCALLRAIRQADTQRWQSSSQLTSAQLGARPSAPWMEAGIFEVEVGGVVESLGGQGVQGDDVHRPRRTRRSTRARARIRFE